MPALAPAPPAGLDLVELMVDGERWAVSRRTGSRGAYDFDWISHPHGYGFGSRAGADWQPSRDELVQQIRAFMAEVDPETGYLPD